MKKHISPLIPLLIIIVISNSCTRVSNEKKQLLQLRDEVRANLTESILPYWSERLTDTIGGGFYGRADWQDKVFKDAERGGVVNSRILWTFSAAFRVMKDSSYFFTAAHARDYILKHFIDSEYGGAYRSVNSNGTPADTRKQIYIESFFVYAFSEHFRATGDSTSLREARNIYNLIQKYAYDTVYNGYYEVFTRDWKRRRDRLIGEKMISSKRL